MSGFARLRRREFGRLERTDQAYLDYTGSALYARSLVRAHLRMLADGVLGNPHSENPASLASTALVERARDRVLAFFRADPAEYTVCFTANATAAIKLVGESYRFAADRPLVLTADNHNSVNGLRCYATRAGAPVRTIPLDHELRAPDPEPFLAGHGGLFAFPAQSNFSGVKHPLAWVERARARGCDVLLDGAAFVPASPLRLDVVRPDFLALSFYKMFGYPTGVGALVARREALARLDRPWFAGGTVDFVSVEHGIHRLRAGAGGFEDGTPDFLAIAAVPAGLDLLERIGMERIQRRVERLTVRLIRGLSSLRHADGTPVVELYGPTSTADRGGTVAFNVRGRAGALIPYWVVEARAAEANVSVRGGCFCNPGAAEAALRVPADRSLDCLQRLADDFTPARFSDCMGGAPVGAVRASVGLPTMPRDIDRLTSVVAEVADCTTDLLARTAASAYASSPLAALPAG
jgi:selenocysteine lyase/cysteine desulfurase